MNQTHEMQTDSETAEEAASAVLFDFAGEEPSWFTVNDDVMGGISTSLVIVDSEAQQLSFSGNLSLDNNGGFASTRSSWTAYDLEEYDGIMLRFRGDGRVYQVRIRTETTGSDIAYAAAFATETGAWQEVVIPFSDMVPLYRGFIVRDAGPLNTAAIRSFGLMLADKQPGEFALDVDWIKAVSIKPSA